MRKKNDHDHGSRGRSNGIAAALALAVTASLGALCAPAAWADSAPSKAPVPSLSDILSSAGITATGYVDATFSAFGYSDPPAGITAPKDYNSFMFQQAGLTLAYQPAAGFGALVDAVVTPYSSVYVDNYAPDTHYYFSSGMAPGTPNVELFQGYAQYATGAWTVIAGKFSTLAGAEVYAPNGDTNVTRSILFSEEPLTHTGVRATYAVNSKLSLILGVNNGWISSGDETSTGPEKTLEAGLSLTANKMWSWALTNYYGRDTLAWGPAGLRGDVEFLDTVLTYNATSALTLIGSLDYGNVGNTPATPSASWWGVAGYVNYALNGQWRVSLRGEYFDDQDGYLTGAYTYLTGTSATPSAGIATAAQKLAEGTLTFGYDPFKDFELRFEGRYDAPQSVDGVSRFPDATQGWVEALFHF
ncbi:MAG: outer membrane beta-barrel protein [Steroidobacteraceae bacterium]